MGDSHQDFGSLPTLPPSFSALYPTFSATPPTLTSLPTLPTSIASIDTSLQNNLAYDRRLDNTLNAILYNNTERLSDAAIKQQKRKLVCKSAHKIAVAALTDKYTRTLIDALRENDEDALFNMLNTREWYYTLRYGYRSKKVNPSFHLNVDFVAIIALIDLIPTTHYTNYISGMVFKWGLGNNEIDTAAASELFGAAISCGSPFLYIHSRECAYTSNDYNDALDKGVIGVGCIMALNTEAAPEEDTLTDEQSAIRKAYLRKDAMLGNGTASAKCARMCYEQKKYKKAAMWYRESAMNGLLTSWNNIGVCYKMIQKHEKADYYYTHAWKFGYRDMLLISKRHPRYNHTRAAFIQIYKDIKKAIIVANSPDFITENNDLLREMGIMVHDVNILQKFNTDICSQRKYKMEHKLSEKRDATARHNLAMSELAVGGSEYNRAKTSFETGCVNAHPDTSECEITSDAECADSTSLANTQD